MKDALKTDHKTSSEIELERLETRLRTIQLALEILTGVCATLPDPELEIAGEDVEGQDEDEGRITDQQSIQLVADAFLHLITQMKEWMTSPTSTWVWNRKR